MPELIDRQAALRLCKDADWEDDRIFIAGYNHAIRTMTQAITELPTIEPEVRHGRWVYADAIDYKDPNGVIHVHGMCSCCRLIYDFRDTTSRFKFCPDCGADMREGGADNG